MTKRDVSYLVLSGNTPQELAGIVTEHMNLGYSCQGGIVRDEERDIYHQAVYRDFTFEKKMEELEREQDLDRQKSREFRESVLGEHKKKKAERSLKIPFISPIKPQE
jgi:hypothetical protein